MDASDSAMWSLIFGVGGSLIVILILWTLIGYPIWRVWAAHREGMADLMMARNEQQVQVAEAHGRLDAAQLNKKAAVVEAEAVALQIEAIGKQLTAHDLYLKWQWIKMMEMRPESSTIYVPTEANIPILEATRLNKVVASTSEEEDES